MDFMRKECFKVCGNKDCTANLVFKTPASPLPFHKIDGIFLIKNMGLPTLTITS